MSLGAAVDSSRLAARRTPPVFFGIFDICRRFWVWVGWVRVGIILHLTLATQLDLDADVFGVWFFFVRAGIILHMTLCYAT